MTCFRHTFRIALVLAAALSLIGCGRRGPLEPPPGAPATNAPATGVADDVSLPKNNTEMAPMDAASTPGAGAAGAATSASPAPAPAKAPARPFPLDPLL